MLARIYTTLFIFAIVGGLVYQKRYLYQSRQEFDAQLDAVNSVLPTATINNFVSNSYDKNNIKYIFSGDKLVYFSDGHFEAQGNLEYQDFSANIKNKLVIKTELARGNLEQSNEKELAIISSKFKNAFFPSNVHFYLNGYSGIGSGITVDWIAQTITSNKLVTINGPQGTLSSIGFTYSLQTGDFTLKSKVAGKFINNPSK